MTRANLKIITKDGVFRFRWSSDAFPKDVKLFLQALADMDEVPDVRWLSENNPAGGLYPGTVGNPYYIYEVDQTRNRVSAWSSEIYWCNAPADWKRRGYVCYRNERTGRYGYHNFRKGKRLNLEDETE